MKIHVVKSGESVWSLSKMYGVTPSSIILANGLQNQANLVIGQAIVIPSKKSSNMVILRLMALYNPLQVKNKLV